MSRSQESEYTQLSSHLPNVLLFPRFHLLLSHVMKILLLFSKSLIILLAFPKASLILTLL